MHSGALLSDICGVWKLFSVNWKDFFHSSTSESANTEPAGIVPIHFTLKCPYPTYRLKSIQKRAVVASLKRLVVAFHNRVVLLSPDLTVVKGSLHIIVKVYLPNSPMDICLFYIIYWVWFIDLSDTESEIAFWQILFIIGCRPRLAERYKSFSLSGFELNTFQF